MLFNSIEYFFFLPLVFLIYWLIGSEHIKRQNSWILVTSYFFYGWWDWRFLFLISFSALVGFFFGIWMERAANPKKEKALLIICLLINLLFLGVFKYFNFFSDSLENLLHIFGFKADFITLKWILPIGISFYTFHNISYIVDVHRKHIPATKDILVYLSFMSFFPQLVAGPIQRAKDLIPQFQKERVFNVNLAVSGLRQILWGLFKKVVIADTCAIHCSEIFNDYTHYSSAALVLGAVYFSFQIYGDFSGYTDIACGTAKLFGFHFLNNFHYPYFAKSIPEFWQRWHISLTTWFKDYVYIPLGGNKKGTLITLRNTSVVFLISGFWHGANWTYIVWGLLNLLYFIPSIFFPKPKNKQEQISFSFRTLLRMMGTFCLITVSWIFFRSATITDALGYLKGIGRLTFSAAEVGKYEYLPLIILMIIWEWIYRKEEYPFEFHKSKPLYRWSVYVISCWLILFYFGEEVEFIYFQF